MGATIIDSNIIIDILDPDSQWASWAKQKISESLLRGRLVFNVVIAAEVAHAFLQADQYNSVFVSAIWKFEDIPFDAALAAGWAHRDYRARGGKREQTLPDFLIGAHASISKHTVLTRNPKRYRSYFPDINIIAPDTHP